MKNSKATLRLVGAMGCWLALLALTGCMLLQPRAVVDFEASPLSGHAPRLVDFTPIVEGDVATYEWDFGDGATSSEVAPTHVYREQGMYSVSLTVQFADGTSREAIKEDLIDVSPPASYKESGGGGIYWLDRNAGTIYSGAPDGATSATVVTGIYRGKHIAIGNGKIYWTAEWMVERANLDGTGRETVLYDGTMVPVGIAVDSAEEKVYWVEKPGGYSDPAEIWKANLDGSLAKVYASGWYSNESGPWFLAVDSVGGRLYWYEMNHPYSGPTIPVSLPDPLDSTMKKSIHWTPVDGFVDHELVGDLRKSTAIALDVGLPQGARYVYWTDPTNDRVLRCKYDEPTMPTLPAPAVYVCLLADSPQALAIDADSGNIYWSNDEGIHRANLSFPAQQELIFPGVRADALAIDL
jgi:PKD repeat protein